MKFTVFLSGFLLLFLIPDLSESADTVNIHTLARIIKYIEDNYKRVDENNNTRQYAAAINVPEKQCQKMNLNHFLIGEDAVNVTNAINDESNGIYEGEKLIAAGLRQIGNTSSYYHSEFLLLRPTCNSPMTRLLNRLNDSCSVFFTLNSPCVGSCLRATNYKNILGPLSEWSEHSGIKAFVFKDIWWRDNQTSTVLETAFKQIAAFIPVYRCMNDTHTQCYACHGEGKSRISTRCLR